MENKAVLISDDSRSICALTAMVLAEDGYQVICEASDGEQAVHECLKCQPDFTLLDVVVPVADGRYALKNIAHYNPKAKIIIPSSLDSKNDVEECLRNGASSHIQKPFEEDVLLRVLDKMA